MTKTGFSAYADWNADKQKRISRSGKSHLCHNFCQKKERRRLKMATASSTSEKKSFPLRVFWIITISFPGSESTRDCSTEINPQTILIGCFRINSNLFSSIAVRFVQITNSKFLFSDILRIPEKCRKCRYANIVQLFCGFKDL